MSRLFQPDGNTVMLGVGDTSVSVALPTTKGVLRIFCDGDVAAFVAFGSADVTAVIPTEGSPSDGMPIGPGRETGVTPPAGATHIAAICVSGSADLYITPGAGV